MARIPVIVPHSYFGKGTTARPQLEVQDILDGLSKYPPDWKVVVQFRNKNDVVATYTPVGLCSWRGSYELLAIEYATGPARQVTVRELALQLVDAVSGRPFEGWKGGDFYMTRGTFVFVDNAGEVGYNEVVAVDHTREGQVIIETELRDF